MLEEAEKFPADMKMYKEEAKKWGPFVFSLTLFAEYHIGKFKVRIYQKDLPFLDLS
jgi:hypothetical protein